MLLAGLCAGCAATPQPVASSQAPDPMPGIVFASPLPDSVDRPLLLRVLAHPPPPGEALADPAGDADLDPAAVDLAFDLVVGTLLHRLATVGDVSQAELEAILGAAVGLLSGRPASG